MDDGTILLILFVTMVMVFSVLMTGFHIVRQDEIGFVYRGKKFVRHSGPGFVMSQPLIGKVHRMKAESLHIMVESPGVRTEAILAIADPQRVPVTVNDMDSEIRNLASEVVLETPSLQDPGKNGKDQRDIAEDLKRRLDEAFKDIGLVVKLLRFGECSIETHQNELAAARIPDWDDLSRRFGY